MNITPYSYFLALSCVFLSIYVNALQCQASRYPFFSTPAPKSPLEPLHQLPGTSQAPSRKEYFSQVFTLPFDVLKQCRWQSVFQFHKQCRRTEDIFVRFHCALEKEEQLHIIQRTKQLKAAREIAYKTEKAMQQARALEGKHFDFASETAGAKVIKTSPGFQGASKVLEGNPDKYMMIPCSQKVKWMVIQLSENIKCTSVAFSNLEHYSSGFKNIQILGSERYPTAQWILLGNITAEDTSDLQTFDMDDQAWVRYVKIRFLSHFHNQHYCTMTHFHAYGLRVLEDLEAGIRDLEGKSKKEQSTSGPLKSDDEKRDEDGIHSSSGDNTRESIFKRLTHRIAALEDDYIEFKKFVESKAVKMMDDAQNWALLVNQMLSDHQDRFRLDVSQSLHLVRKMSIEYDQSIDQLLEMRREVSYLEDQLRTVEILIIALVLLLIVLFLLFSFSVFCFSTMRSRGNSSADLTRKLSQVISSPFKHPYHTNDEVSTPHFSEFSMGGRMSKKKKRSKRK